MFAGEWYEIEMAKHRRGCEAWWSMMLVMLDNADDHDPEPLALATAIDQQMLAA